MAKVKTARVKSMKETDRIAQRIKKQTDAYAKRLKKKV